MSSYIVWNIAGSCNVEIDAEEAVVSDEYDRGEDDNCWEEVSGIPSLVEDRDEVGELEADTQGVRAADVRPAVSISNSTMYLATWRFRRERIIGTNLWNQVLKRWKKVGLKMTVNNKANVEDNGLTLIFFVSQTHWVANDPVTIRVTSKNEDSINVRTYTAVILSHRAGFGMTYSDISLNFSDEK